MIGSRNRTTTSTVLSFRHDIPRSVAIKLTAPSVQILTASMPRLCPTHCLSTSTYSNSIPIPADVSKNGQISDKVFFTASFGLVQKTFGRGKYQQTVFREPGKSSFSLLGPACKLEKKILHRKCGRFCPGGGEH